MIRISNLLTVRAPLNISSENYIRLSSKIKWNITED